MLKTGWLDTIYAAKWTVHLPPASKLLNHEVAECMWCKVKCPASNCSDEAVPLDVTWWLNTNTKYGLTKVIASPEANHAMIVWLPSS